MTDFAVTVLAIVLALIAWREIDGSRTNLVRAVICHMTDGEVPCIRPAEPEE